jgi:polyphosphate kinase 2 (PPK2 family)
MPLQQNSRDPRADGSIKHVAGCLNPRGVSVASFGEPTTQELEYDLPVASTTRPAARRVLHLQPLPLRGRAGRPRPSPSAEKVWQTRFDQIRDFEEPIAAHVIIVLKYCCTSPRKSRRTACSSEEDARRRGRSAPTNWKERDYWDDYTAPTRPRSRGLGQASAVDGRAGGCEVVP